MPEGPEVRHNAELLGRLIVGKVIEELRPTTGKLQRQGIPNADKFKPSKVTAVYAVGKLIVISFADGACLTSTLGMSGWWYASTSHTYHHDKAYKAGKLVSAESVIASALKHSRVSLIAYGKSVAEFTDMRNFGNMAYYPTGITRQQLKDRIGLDLLNELPHMMVDPLKAKAKVLELKATATKRLLNMKIGDLALEQSFIAGLGNIYRAETLWLTRIDPHTKFRDLTEHEWLMFCEVGMVVLEIAYNTSGVMLYPADLIEGCTGSPVLINGVKPKHHRGHLAYGREVDAFGKKITRDTTFGRPLWYTKPEMNDTIMEP